MTWPTLKVEIAFASDPLDETPTWVDVSAYVRQNPGVSVQRGRPGEPGQPDNAGVCTFTLSNRDRRFDPTYAAGPYAGQLRARKQVQVTATWSAVDYPVFRGFVSGFPVTGAAMGMDSVVEVVCYDALGFLAGDRLTSDPLYDYVDPTLIGAGAWWRNVSAEHWYDAASASAILDLNVVGDLRPGKSLAAGLQSSSWESDGASYATTSKRGTLYDYSFGWWMQTTSKGPISAASNEPDLTLFSYDPADSTLQWTATVDSSGFLHLDSQNGADVTSLTTSVVVADGSVHFIMITCYINDFVVYVDGVADAGLVVDSTDCSDIALENVGAGWITVNETGQAIAPIPRAAWGVVLQDVLYSPGYIYSAAEVATMYQLGLGYAVESTADRATRILDDAGWPAAWRSIATDTRGQVGELIYSGQLVLTGLQQVERSEQGRIFAAKDGTLTFTGRYTYAEVTRSNTVQATLSDDGAGEGYRTLRYDTGIADIANDITVHNNPNSARSTDTASKTTYGTTADTVDTNLSTYAQLRDMAAGLVYQRKDPAVRFDPLVITPADWPTVFGLELGDRIAIESTPMGVGTQAVQAALIDSIAWDISAASGWWFTVAGSPVPANSFWLLGTSVLGVDTVPGF